MGGSGVQIHLPLTFVWKAGDELENGIGPLNAFATVVSLILLISLIHGGIFSTWNSARHRVGDQQIFTELKNESIFVSYVLPKVLVL